MIDHSFLTVVFMVKLSLPNVALCTLLSCLSSILNIHLQLYLFEIVYIHVNNLIWFLFCFKVSGLKRSGTVVQNGNLLH